MLKSCITLRRLAWSTTFMLFIGALLLTWSVIRQQESTLAIRAVNQAAVCPKCGNGADLIGKPGSQHA